MWNTVYHRYCILNTAIAIAQARSFAWCARVHATWVYSLNEHCHAYNAFELCCAWNITCESPLPRTRYRSCSAASFQRVQFSCTLSSPALHAWQCTLLQRWGRIPTGLSIIARRQLRWRGNIYCHSTQYQYTIELLYPYLVDSWYK